MRYLFVVLSGIGLSGCALPVSLQIASFAASGLSYMTTGKSMSDHAVSAMVSQDCAVHRIVLGLGMCEAYVDENNGIAVAQGEPATEDTAAQDSATKHLRDSMVSLAERLDGDLQPASGPVASEPVAILLPAGNDEQASGARNDESSSALEPVDRVLVAMAETINSLPPAGKSDEGAIGDRTASAQHYLIIGLFRQFQEAETVRTRHAGLRTVVRMVLDDGALMFQVIAGPFSRPDAIDIAATIADGDAPPKIALLCADRASRAPCGGQTGYASVRVSLHPAAAK
ncbi:MAG: hypothetical protein WD767_00390 [Alphaproteobacteria bacterium]